MLRGIIFAGAYHLWRRRLAGLPLTVWLVVVLAILATVGLLGLGGAPGFLGLISLPLVLLLLALAIWAAKEGYLTFQAEDFAPSPKPLLQPDEKVFVRASGYFEVEGKKGYFVDLAAAFETFETREHAVLAYVPPSPLWPRNQVGMWYVFFKPQDVKRLEWGRISFGRKALPALRITYQTSKGERTVYLASPHIERLMRIWQDIELDMGTEQ